MDNANDAARLEPVLAELTEAARRAFGAGLVSVVLFGSAAENRLRASSDVNLMILLERVEQAALDAFREPLRATHAAIRAEVMILTRNELQTAAQLFPVKYSDMRARHRVLAGTDPFERLEIPDSDVRRQTREILMNTALRLRERYVRLSIRDEQLVPVIADSAGPLRAAAAALARLEGTNAASPREALANLAGKSAWSTPPRSPIFPARARRARFPRAAQARRFSRFRVLRRCFASAPAGVRHADERHRPTVSAAVRRRGGGGESLAALALPQPGARGEGRAFEPHQRSLPDRAPACRTRRGDSRGGDHAARPRSPRRGGRTAARAAGRCRGARAPSPRPSVAGALQGSGAGRPCADVRRRARRV